MKFMSKIKSLKNAGFVFTVNKDSESINIILDDNISLYFRDYRTRRLDKGSRSIECDVFTLKELIEKEAETIVSCYYDEFEHMLKNDNRWNEGNLHIIIDSLIGTPLEQEKKAKKLCFEQIESRLLTKFNCLTLGDSELIADKFYICPL